MTRTTRGDASHLGRGAVGGFKVPMPKIFIVHAERQALEGGSDKVRRFGDIEAREGEVHLLIMQTLPVESRILTDGALRPLTSGQNIGSLKFCGLRTLKQSLKGKLHNSVFHG